MTLIKTENRKTGNSCTTQPITAENKDLYVTYCKTYRFEHDESDLYDEDLFAFDPDPSKQPTFMLQNEKGEACGMVSIRIMPYLENQQRARFSIFHVAEPTLEAYELLWKAIEPFTKALHHVFLFLPEAKPDIGDIMKSFGFALDRFVWVLDRADLPVEPPQFPEEMSLRAYIDAEDAPDWCNVRNGAFASLRGSETPIGVEEVEKMTKDIGAVEGGMMILSNAAGPVGVIRVGKEIEEEKTYAFIGPVAVLPAYQGQGLGRQLLRAGLAFGRDHEMPNAMLCVNADNEQAADLYLSEGFEKQVVMICYKRETI